ncbi:MAG: IS1634 family transposase [Deltaproteobacteria bacterium]|nr:IS1634 family transposase [Deltaproteobacteria bacterium]
MFLRCTKRRKDGKEHRYWNVVENRRVAGGRVVQRQVLYLGEINDSQREAWRKTIEVFEDGMPRPRTMALFPEDRPVEIDDDEVVQIRLKDLELHRPRQWGACWLACSVYEQLGLDSFWAKRLEPSRKGTRWDLITQTLSCYRLIDPGSEWRLHRDWYDNSAMGDLLGAGFELVEIHKLYECLDKLLVHKQALFDHLTQRWKDLFNVKFDVLLYDLTSTYFESDPPFPEGDKRKYGYSRDKRSDCVQVVIALVVTPEGFPLAYEVLAGNTADKTTLRGFLNQIEEQYGKADRVWVMDRGIPTEKVLEKMRESDPPITYLVGTPKGRLNRYEKALTEKPWHKVRDGVEVKLLPEDGEVYVLAQSHNRINKERSMRRRQLKKLWRRLHELQDMKVTRDQLLLKLGAAKQQSPSAWRLVQIDIPDGKGPLRFSLRKDKIRSVRRREGRYLLRTNLLGSEPAQIWEFYIQLVQVEEAFKTLKGDLAVRPIHHQKEHRIEAHIFVAFIAYCMHVTLRRRLSDLAPGLTPRSVLEKFGAVQMIDVHLPTTDGRKVIMSRYTQPEPELQVLLKQLRLSLPAQPPPRVTAKGEVTKSRDVVKTF